MNQYEFDPKRIPYVFRCEKCNEPLGKCNCPKNRR